MFIKQILAHGLHRQSIGASSSIWYQSGGCSVLVYMRMAEWVGGRFVVETWVSSALLLFLLLMLFCICFDFPLWPPFTSQVLIITRRMSFFRTVLPLRLPVTYSHSDVMLDHGFYWLIALRKQTYSSVFVKSGHYIIHQRTLLIMQQKSIKTHAM